MQKMSNNSSPKDSLILLRKSTLKKSGASNLVKLPPIQRKRTDARWDIMGLPSDWVPDETPSLKLAELQERRENRHRESIEKMREEMARVNQGVSSKIKSESESLKRFLRDCHAKVEGAWKRIYVSPNIKEVKLSGTMFEDASNLINETSNEARQEICKLYKYLQVLEKGRSQQFKSILQEYYPKLHEISFKMPYEIQEFFELEIQNINQITLSNYRNYEELNRQLCLNAENDLRLWLQKFDTYKKSYQIHCELLKQIASENPSEEQGLMKKESNKRNVINEKVTAIATKIKLFESRIMETRSAMETIINKIHMGTYDEIAYPQLCLAKQSKMLLSADLTEEVYNSLFADPKNPDNSTEQFTRDRISQWFTLLDAIEEDYETTSYFVERTLHLWDDHFHRLFQLKELTIADLKKLIKQLSVAPDIEVNKINMYTDKIRQASSEPELNGLMTEVKKCLDNVNNLAILNHRAQQDFFDKFRDFMKIEVDFLVGELQSFLNKIRKDSDVNPTRQRGRLSWMETKEEPEMKKVNIIRVMENQITLLHNWNFGIHETILFAANNTPAYLEEETEKWITLQNVQLLRRLEFNSALHNPKFQRVYVYIYKIRLAELKVHRQRLEEHKLGVHAELKKMKDFSDLIKYDDVLSEAAATIQGLNEKAMAAKNLGAIESIKTQIKIMQDKKLQTMENLRADYIEYAHNTLDQIKYCSAEYLKSLRLFSEGGNYSCNEIKKIKEDLWNINKNIGKDFELILKEITAVFYKKKYELEDKIEEIMDNVSSIKAEFDFHKNTSEEIRKVQTDIKEHTYELKYKFKIAQLLFKRLKEFAREHISKVEFLSEFSENCEFLERTFQEVRASLLQTQPFKFNLKLFTNSAGEASLDNRIIKQNIHEMAESVTEGYSTLVFESVPEGTDYMCKCINALYSSVNTIQNLAKSFYYGNWNVVNVDLIKPNIKGFMVEVLSKYLYYQLQCEEVWLEISMNYMVLLNDMLEFIKQNYTASVEMYLQRNLDRFEKKCNNFDSYMTNLIENIEGDFRKVYEQLKPLHGHPRNRSLLDQLEAEMDAINNKALDSQQHIIAKHEEITAVFNENMEQFEGDLLKIEDNLKQNLIKYTTKVANDVELFNQIHDRIMYLTEIICSDCPYQDDSNLYINFISELNFKINYLKASLRIKTKNLSDFSDLLSRLKSSRELLQLQFKISTVHDEHYMYIDTESLLEIYMAKQKKCLEKLDLSQKVLEIASYYTQLWRCEVDCVKKLYSIKYPLQ